MSGNWLSERKRTLVKPQAMPAGFDQKQNLGSLSVLIAVATMTVRFRASAHRVGRGSEYLSDPHQGCQIRLTPPRDVVPIPPFAQSDAPRCLCMRNAERFGSFVAKTSIERIVPDGPHTSMYDPLPLDKANRGACGEGTVRR